MQAVVGTNEPRVSALRVSTMRRMGGVYHCHSQAETAQGRPPVGRVALRFQVREDKVVNIRVHEDTARNTTLTGCLARWLRGIRVAHDDEIDATTFEIAVTFRAPP